MHSCPSHVLRYIYTSFRCVSDVTIDRNLSDFLFFRKKYSQKRRFHFSCFSRFFCLPFQRGCADTGMKRENWLHRYISEGIRRCVKLPRKKKEKKERKGEARKHRRQFRQRFHYSTISTEKKTGRVSIFSRRTIAFSALVLKVPDTGDAGNCIGNEITLEEHVTL